MNITYVPHSDNRYYFDEDLNLYGPSGLLTLPISKAGYKSVFIDRKYMPTIRSYHRAIAETFIPNPENKPCVNHINGIKTDNRVENLEWVTYAENTKHALLTGLYTPLKGEEVSSAKLTIDDIKNIINAILTEHATNEQLGEQYNLHSRYISLIRHKHRWKHVWDEYFPGAIPPKSNQLVTPYSTESQFSTEQRLQIIRAIFEDGLTNTQIQHKYHIERSNVSRIRHHKMWKVTLNDYFKSLTAIPQGSTSEAIADGNSKDPSND